MSKILAGVFGFIVVMTISVLIMINGWGLEPKNWWWIVGMGLINIAISTLVQAALRDS